MQVFKISYFNRKIHEGFLFLINSVTALVISVSHIDGLTKQKGYIKGKPFFFFFSELGQCLILGNKLIKEIPSILFYISIVYRIEFINKLKGGKEANDFWSVSHYFLYRLCKLLAASNWSIKDHGWREAFTWQFLLFPGAVPILIHLTKIIAQELNFAYIRKQN